MKKLLTLLVCFVAVTLSSCGYRVAKDTPEPKISVSVKTERPKDLLADILTKKDPTLLETILAEMLHDGEILGKYIRAKRFPNNAEVSFERWFIKNSTKTPHVVIFETGILIDIIPIDKSEGAMDAAKKKYVPFGNWKNK